MEITQGGIFQHVTTTTSHFKGAPFEAKVSLQDPSALLFHQIASIIF